MSRPRQRKTVTICQKFPEHSNKLSFYLFVPFKPTQIILKSISVVLPGLEWAGVADDGLYVIKTNILQDSDVLYHFAMETNKFGGDDTEGYYNISAHSDTEITYDIQSRDYNSTFNITIENINGEPPTNISSMGYISLCCTLEFLE